MANAIKVYKSYMFADKDPAIFAVRDAIEKSKATWDTVCEDSGVSKSTLYNWLQGPTRRPQFATLNAVARVIGFEFRLLRRKNTPE